MNTPERSFQKFDLFYYIVNNSGTEPRSPRCSFKPHPRRSGATTVMSGDMDRNCFASGACQPE